jgi:hypothetical protein
VGSTEGDPRTMTSTTAAPRRRRKPVAHVAATVTAEPKPYTPSPEFARAYANPHNEIGPIASRWNERGIAEWLLPVNAGR